MGSRSQTPWWAEEGDEICPSCLQTYHYHLGYRCDSCDAPLCPECCERARHDPSVCHGCKDAEAAD